jgi:hypothetical protein
MRERAAEEHSNQETEHGAPKLPQPQGSCAACKDAAFGIGIRGWNGELDQVDGALCQVARHNCGWRISAESLAHERILNTHRHHARASNGHDSPRVGLDCQRTESDTRYAK